MTMHAQCTVLDDDDDWGLRARRWQIARCLTDCSSLCSVRYVCVFSAVSARPSVARLTVQLLEGLLVRRLRRR